MAYMEKRAQRTLPLFVYEWEGHVLCMWRCMHVCAHIYVEARGWCWGVSSQATLFLILWVTVSLNLGLTDSARLPGGKHQGHPHLCLLQRGQRRSRCSGYCGSRLSLWRIWSFLSQRRCSLWNTYLGVECPSSPFFWSNLNDFFLTELSLITLNRFLVQFLFHYFMTLISSNAVSCAQICQLLTSGLDACTVDVLTNSALPSHCCCNSQTSQLAVFKHRAVFEEGPGGLVKTKPMPSLWTFHTTFSNSSKRKPTLTSPHGHFLAALLIRSKTSHVSSPLPRQKSRYKQRNSTQYLKRMN